MDADPPAENHLKTRTPSGPSSRDFGTNTLETPLPGIGRAGPYPIIRKIAPPTGAALFSLGMVGGSLDYAAGDSMLCLGASLLLLIVMISPPPLIFWRRLGPPLLLLGLALVWATLPLLVPSRFPVIAPDLLPGNLLGLTAMIAAFLAGARLGYDGGRLQSAGAWLVAFACLVALAGLLTVITPSGLILEPWHPSPNGRLMGTVGNANVAGCYFAANAVLAFSLVLSAGRRPRRGSRQAGAAMRRQFQLFAGFMALLLLMGTCLLTASRTSMALALLSLVLLAVLPARRATPIPLLGSAAVLVVAGIASSELMFDRFRTLQTDGIGRLMLWGHGLSIAGAAPIQGFGLGSFPLVSASMFNDALKAEHLWPVNSAHNKLIQLVIEGGWPYAALITAAALLIAWRVGAGLVRTRYPPAALALAAAALVVVGVGMVDIALDVPALVGWMMFVVGLAFGRLAALQDRTVNSAGRVPAQQ